MVSGGWRWRIGAGLVRPELGTNVILGEALTLIGFTWTGEGGGGVRSREGAEGGQQGGLGELVCVLQWSQFRQLVGQRSHTGVQGVGGFG